MRRDQGDLGLNFGVAARPIGLALASLEALSPDSEAIGVLTSSIGGVACLRFGHAGAAAGCCLRVLLSELCVCARFGAGMLVPLQGAGAE